MVEGRGFWPNRPTLVTGASGLVGSWLVSRLLDLGADVVCLVRDWVPTSRLIRGGLQERVKVVRGDVREQSLLARALGEYEVDTVLHLAAQTIVGIANRNPVATFETNVAGTWALLEACRHTPTVKQIVVASSDKAYGEQSKLPYDEDTPLQGNHPYDVSKSCADLLAQAYAQTYELPVVITRCGNIYGGGDLNWNRLVPGTIRAVLHGRQPLIRSNGRFVRDYFYVEDAAAVYTLLAEQLAADPTLHGAAFNFSNEEPLPVLELVDRVLKVMGSSATPRIEDRAVHEIPCQYLSAARARQRFGWKAMFTLEEGLRNTVAWYEQFLLT